MAFIVGELAAPITGDPSQFNRALADTKRQGEAWATSLGAKFSSVGNSMDKLGKDMSLKVTAPIVAGMGLSVRETALLEGAMDKFNVVFGESRDIMADWVEEYRSNVPLARREIVQHSAAMQDLLVPMGIARKEAMGQTQDWMQLAAALSAFNDVPVPQALEAIRSAIVGSSEPIRQFGIDARVAALEQVALEEGLMKAGQEMTDQIRVQALLIQATRQSADAINGYEEQQGSLLMMQDELGASVKDLAADFGEQLMPIAKDLVTEASDLVRWFGSLDDETKKQIITWGAYAAAAGPVIMVLGNVSKGVGNILSLSKTFTSTLNATAKTAIPAATGAAKGMGSTFAGLGAAAGPIALTVTALAGLGTAFYILDSQVNEKTKSIEQQVKERFTEATEEAGRKIAEMNQAVSDEFEGMTDNVIGQLLNIKIGVKETSEETYQGVIDEVENMRARALELLEQHNEEGLQALTNYHEEAGTLNSEEYASAYKRLQGHYAMQTTEIETAYDNINMIIAEAMAEGRQITQEEWDTILAILDGANNEVVDKERWLEGQLAAVFADITEDSKEATKERAEAVLDILKQAHQNELDEIAKQSDARIEEILMAYNRGEIATREELDKQLALVQKSELEKTLAAKEAHMERLEDQQWALDAMGLVIDEGSGNLLTHWQATWARIKGENEDFLEEVQERTRSGYYGAAAAGWSNYGKAVEEHSPQVIEATRVTMDDVLAEIDSAKEHARRSGEEFTAGIVHGIVSGRAAAIKAAEDLADSINEQFRTKLEIASPSRVMMDAGKELPAGVAKGILGNLGVVKDAVGSLAGTIGLPQFGSSPGAMGPQNSSVTNRYNFAPGAIQVLAKDLREVQDVVELFRKLPQAVRAGGVG